MTNLNILHQEPTGVPKFNKEKHLTRVVDLLTTQLAPFKQKTIISDYRNDPLHPWHASGIVPGSSSLSGINTEITFEDIISQVEKYPDQKFDLDCNIPNNIIYITNDHNRKAKHEKCVDNLNKRNGFNYQSAGRVTVYLAKLDDKWIGVVEMGTHRVIKSIFQFGEEGFIRSNIVYDGTLDLELILKNDMYGVHFSDMNYRKPQTPEERIVSGVKANDPNMVKIYNILCELNLTVKDACNDFFHNKITCVTSSWSNLEFVIGKLDFESVLYATKMIQKHDKIDGKVKVLTQAQEVIGTIQKNFSDTLSRWSDDIVQDDFFDCFLEDYFVKKEYTQKDIRSTTNVEENVMEMMQKMNRFGKKKVANRQHKMFTNKDFIEVYPNFDGKLNLN